MTIDYTDLRRWPLEVLTRSGDVEAQAELASRDAVSDSRELQLARQGAILFIPAALITDEIREELDAWSELGYVIQECGCLVGGSLPHPHTNLPAPHGSQTTT